MALTMGVELSPWDRGELGSCIITRQAIRRDTVTSVPDLLTAIRAFIDGCNDRSHPASGRRPPTTS